MHMHSDVLYAHDSAELHGFQHLIIMRRTNAVSSHLIRAQLLPDLACDSSGCLTYSLHITGTTSATSVPFLLCVAEALASSTPSSAARAQLLLDLAARKPQDAQYAAWILPLAAAALLNAAPCASPHLWLQASIACFCNSWRGCGFIVSYAWVVVQVLGLACFLALWRACLLTTTSHVCRICHKGRCILPQGASPCNAVLLSCQLSHANQVMPLESCN